MTTANNAAPAAEALRGLAAGARVVFFSGKGGVGKTTTAAATAVALADAGERVLLVSTDPAHNLGHLFERRLKDTPSTLATTAAGGRLDALEIDPAAATAGHLKEVGATIRAMMPEHLHREVDKYLRLAADAPGTHEASVLERIAELTEELTDTDGYDVVVFDTAPSGHTARLMALPDLMTAWTDGLLRRREASERFGEAVVGLGGKRQAEDNRDARIRSVLTRRRDRFARLRGLLADRDRCAFVLVLAAERLPVAETIEFHEQLRAQGIGVRALVINKRSPGDAGEFLARRRKAEERYVAELRQAVPDPPVLNIRLAPDELRGLDGLWSLPDLVEN
ncbi:ArsA family ATPase [Zhihengliuella sp.]|uniref:ArsA family ATPase n=1 Tax=Zhihengliuella sp. TaxID=1954483 RepID=UPI0028128C0C|nr:ArsA family ATPase [Zhihengliuella sp.]